MRPKNRNAGKYRGFFDSSTCPEKICAPAQTRNRTAAPDSKAKVDQSSTAPNAKTANIKRPQRPRASTHRRIRGLAARRGSKSVASVVSTNAYDDIFNFSDP